MMRFFTLFSKYNYFPRCAKSCFFSSFCAAVKSYCIIMLLTRICNLVFENCKQTGLSKMISIVEFTAKAKLELVKVDLN